MAQWSATLLADSDKLLEGYRIHVDVCDRLFTKTCDYTIHLQASQQCSLIVLFVPT